MTTQRELPDIVEAVTTELLAHGEFSSGANNYANARIAACKVIDIVTRLRASPTPCSPPSERPVAQVREALQWYAGEAQAANKAMSETHNPDVMFAILTVLANDAGKRARKALARIAEHP